MIFEIKIIRCDSNSDNKADIERLVRIIGNEDNRDWIGKPGIIWHSEDNVTVIENGKN